MLETRLAIWQGTDAWRTEAATIDLSAPGMHAAGTQVAADPLPYRLDYRLAAHGFVTQSMAVDVVGEGWWRTLVLTRDGEGDWAIETHGDGDPALPPAGGDPAALAGAIDCDLGLSPLTNLMPIRREGLGEGAGGGVHLMAFVSVPDLAVVPDRQRYEHVRRVGDGAVVRFTSLEGPFEGFSADLVLDADGLVLDYPGLARRIGS